MHFCFCFLLFIFTFLSHYSTFYCVSCTFSTFELIHFLVLWPCSSRQAQELQRQKELERERQERERQEQERLEQEMLERERERQEREAQAERERQEQQEREVMEREKAERERLEREQQEQLDREQQDWDRGRRISNAGKSHSNNNTYCCSIIIFITKSNSEINMRLCGTSVGHGRFL